MSESIPFSIAMFISAIALFKDTLIGPASGVFLFLTGLLLFVVPPGGGPVGFGGVLFSSISIGGGVGLSFGFLFTVPGAFIVCFLVFPPSGGGAGGGGGDV